MKTITFTINYGGYLGADDEYYVEVDDDATQEEIEDAVEKEFEEQIRDNCSYEITKVEENEDD